MKIKTVLLVSPIPPPTGGIASWTIHLLNYFQENSTNINIVHFNNSIKGRRITDSNILKRLYFGIINFFRTIFGILKSVRQNNIDLVHLTSSASYGLFRDLLLLIILKILGYSTCIHFRFGRIPELHNSNNWEWKLLKIVSCLAKKVIVIDLKSYSVLKVFDSINSYYLPNPISQTIQAQINDLSIIKRNYGEVLFVGHVTKQKGIFELINACINIEKVTKIRIIGPYEINVYNEIIKLISTKKDHNWIIFEGIKSVDSIIENMHKCSVFVLPSYTEGFPNVILEAMASASPIIATDVGAIPDMLDINSDNPVGICVKPRNVSQLEKAICRILNDFEKASKYGKNAKCKVFSDYSMDKIMKDLISIWKNK